MNFKSAQPTSRSGFYSWKLSLNFLILLCLTIIWSAMTGCEGPVGPAGKNVEGVDVVPPTIFLAQPWPLSEIWDELVISASAVDNVAIRNVVFNLDGSPLFSTSDPPYATTFALDNVVQGWHFLSARAYDTAGNITDTPVVPVRLGLSKSLSDTIVQVSYHNGRLEKLWTIPDTAKAEAFWTRFSVAKKCYLKQVLINFEANLQDTAEVLVQVWSGETMPEDLDTTITLTAQRLTPDMQKRRIDFGVPGLHREKEFFIMISLAKNTSTDTLKLGADVGEPSWSRCGARDDEIQQMLFTRYARQDNFLIDCLLYYEHVEEDTSGQE